MLLSKKLLYLYLDTIPNKYDLLYSVLSSRKYLFI